jgi:hypothetical protein
MPRFVPKHQVDGPEPVHDLPNWPAWALERVREALRAGAPPPPFAQTSPWAYYGLMCKVFDDAELRDRAFVDIRERRVRWEQPEDDDSRAA